MQEQILIYIDPARHAEIIECISRWVPISPLAPRTYELSSAGGKGYVYFDQQMRIATIDLEAVDHSTEPASLAHMMWLISFGEDIVQHGIALAIIVGAKDDIDSTNIVEQARHAAAWYPEALLGEERELYLKVGSFRVSPYAPDHLTTFMTPSGAAEGADREVVATMNAFMARQREESARRSARAETIAGEAMRRLREGQGRDRD